MAEFATEIMKRYGFYPRKGLFRQYVDVYRNGELARGTVKSPSYSDPFECAREQYRSKIVRPAINGTFITRITDDGEDYLLISEKFFENLGVNNEYVEKDLNHIYLYYGDDLVLIAILKKDNLVPYPGIFKKYHRNTNSITDLGKIYSFIVYQPNICSTTIELLGLFSGEAGVYQAAVDWFDPRECSLTRGSQSNRTFSSPLEAFNFLRVITMNYVVCDCADSSFYLYRITKDENDYAILHSYIVEGRHTQRVETEETVELLNGKHVQCIVYKKPPMHHVRYPLNGERYYNFETSKLEKPESIKKMFHWEDI